MALSEKSTYLRAFNTHFFDFLDDICVIIPDNQEIVVAKTSFSTIKQANPTAILKAWHQFVYIPYKTVIEQGNITFFFDKDYGKDLAHLSNAANIMAIINTIREPIKGMSETNLAHTTKYIQNLCKLATLYVEC